MKYDTCPWINDLDTSFKVYHELMTHKVWEILLVLSPYDAFIMEEDSSLCSQKEIQPGYHPAPGR
jgi:hypothetical protein